MEPNIDERGVEWRRCTRCGTYKELEAGFPLSPQHKAGRSTWCKACCSARDRERRREKREAERGKPRPKPNWGEGSFDAEGHWQPDPRMVEWLKKQKEARKAANRESEEQRRVRDNAHRRQRRRLDPSYGRSRKERGLA